ncbi:unnamed protein product, partial [Pylaiella littoralis]
AAAVEIIFLNEDCPHKQVRDLWHLGPAASHYKHRTQSTKHTGSHHESCTACMCC